MKEVKPIQNLKYVIDAQVSKQGRTHGSRSPVRLGRGSEERGFPKHLGTSSNAKTARNVKKAMDRPTNGPADRQSGL